MVAGQPSPVGQMAERCGVTLHHYGSIGLVVPDRRTDPAVRSRPWSETTRMPTIFFPSV